MKTLIVSTIIIIFLSASTTAQNNFIWSFEIEQNDTTILPQNNTYTLKKYPFILRFILPKNYPVMINLSSKQDNFKNIKAGLKFDSNEFHCFSFGTGMAEYPKNRTEKMYINDSGHHFIYFTNVYNHRWSSFQITNDKAIFERKVSYLMETDGKEKSIPIKDIHFKQLYIIMIIEINQKYIHKNAIKKIILKYNKN